MSGSFVPVPAPLLIDSNKTQLHRSEDILRRKVRVYFNIIAVYYLTQLHMKSLLLMVEPLPEEAMSPNKRLKEEQLI